MLLRCGIKSSEFTGFYMLKYIGLAKNFVWLFPKELKNPKELFGQHSTCTDNFVSVPACWGAQAKTEAPPRLPVPSPQYPQITSFMLLMIVFISFA